MAEIERLTTVWDARFDKIEEKLNKVVRSTYGAASKVEKRLDATNDNIARKFGRGIGESARAGLDDLASRAGPAASALSGLGVAGLAAAAAVGALTVALGGAREAVRFADEIADTAKRLHVTTDALQEYRYAIRVAGGDTEGAEQALEKFSVTLGNAQGGVARAEKAFLTLGFSKEQIAGFKDADTALKAVTERIGGLSNVQQDAAIKRLGLDGLKPLIQEGADEFERLRAEAHKVGFVMDSELIKRGAKLNDEFETAVAVIDVHLKSALIDLAPILLDLLRFAADLAREMADIADLFRVVENRRTSTLKRQREQFVERQQGPLAPFYRKNDQEKIARIDAELASRAAEEAIPPPRPTRELIRPAGGGGRSRQTRDSTASRVAQVEAAILDAERDLLSAWSDLVVNNEARADISRLMLDVEKQMADSRLDKQIEDIRDDEGLTKAKKDELVAKLEIVRLEQGKVFDLKREAIDREAAEKAAADALELRQVELEGQQDALRVQASLARTQAQRREIELRLLDLADQRAKAELEAVLASQRSSDIEKEIARRKLEQLDATRASREEVVRQGTQGPLEDYFDSLPKTAEEVNERLETLAANGIQSVVDGLAEAAVGARSFGDVFRSIIMQMAIDITRLNLQALLAKVFPKLGGAKPGADAGTAITTAGASAGTAMGTAITTAGATSAQTMAAAIVAAGSQAATAMAAAVAGGGATGGASGLLSLFGGFGGGGDPLAGLYANGTRHSVGGRVLVGEHGPEVVKLPRGAEVFSSLRSRQMMAQGGSTFSPTLNVTVAGSGMSAADARRTGSQVGAAAMRELAMAKRRGY